MSAAASYDIQVDPELKAIRMTIRGYWKPKTVHAFACELETLESRLRAEGQDLSYLCDARAFRVQPQDVGAVFHDFLKRRNALGLRTAVVTPTGLSRMQIARVLGASSRRVFRTMEEATSWLRQAEACSGRDVA